MKRLLCILLLVAGARAALAQSQSAAEPLQNVAVRLDGGDLVPAGTVTSVGLSAPPEFVVANSPILTSGTLGLTWVTGKSLPYATKSMTLTTPTNADNVTIFFTPEAITITSVRAVVVGSSPSVTYNVKYSTDRSAAGTSVTTAPAATTNTTTGVEATLDNTAVAANSYIWLTTSAKSGTVSDINVTVRYTAP